MQFYLVPVFPDRRDHGTRAQSMWVATTDRFHVLILVRHEWPFAAESTPYPSISVLKTHFNP